MGIGHACVLLLADGDAAIQADGFLNAVSQAIRDQAEFRSLIHDPAIPRTARRSVLCQLADNHGMPSDMSHVAAHDYVGYVDGPSNWSAYIRFVDQAKPTRLVSRSNTVTNMKAMIKSSVGVGLLPCFVADPEPDLIRCFAPMRQLDAES